MRDELQQEGTRLTNRMREQLRRHYPQMLELGGDLGATWFVELWEKAPTPAEAARIRKASIAAILKRNRIRRHDAAGVLRILRLWRANRTVRSGARQRSTNGGLSEQFSSRVVGR